MITDLSQQLSQVITASIPDLKSRLQHDPEVHLELIKQTDQARDQLNALLLSSVLAARNAGQSWEAIGQTLGMTRQAAQQRFGKSLSTEQIRTTRRLTPLTSLDEMTILNRAGKYGWHSVGFGTLYHDIEQDTVQWEHRRVVAFDPSRHMLEQEGWQRIGTMWFPWAYYARPTNKAALSTSSEVDFCSETLE